MVARLNWETAFDLTPPVHVVDVAVVVLVVSSPPSSGGRGKKSK